VLADGRELVDGIASWWTAAHGYNHPHIAERVRAQLEVLPHVAFGGLAHEPAYALAARLCDFVGQPFERVFFTESGSVAVEVALKIALQFHQNQGRSRQTVLTFEGGYHGDTFATMSLCDPLDGMHRAFTQTGVKAVHAKLPLEESALDATLDSVGDDLACIIVEPLLQGAGGMHLYAAPVLQRLRNAATARGALLIFDEIATGFHRLGSAFAFRSANVIPDLLVIGKALTGGTLPLAATLSTARVFDAFLGDTQDLALQHGPTYMGNALACAAALASLDLFAASDYSARVAKLEASLHTIGRSLATIRGANNVRVHGALLAVDLAPGTAPSSNAFAKHGAFIRPLRNRRADVVYVTPPLTIEDSELETLGNALVQTLQRSS
jgi:adenosylmethionine---8-amino-7-oxononanoate aminotransferase